MKHIFALFLCVFPFAVLADSIILNVLHQPPYVIDSSELSESSKRSSPHRFYGVDVEIVRAAYASQGVQVQFKDDAWQRTLRDVKIGRTLGSLACRHVPEREAFAWFSDEVVSSSYALIAPHGRVLEDRIDLTEFGQFNSINVVHGWSQGQYLDKAGFSYRTVGGLEQGLNLVANRPQEVFFTEYLSALYLANQLGLRKELSFHLVKGIDVGGMAVCFSKAFPESKKWQEVLNKGLKEIRLNGQWQAIWNRYES
ncbi:substrate-binding periplasmic protein [Marinomonas epiphytica]